MPDREKVIRGLECHYNPFGCPDCPYWDKTEPLKDCNKDQLILDALALLREQETEYTPDGPDFVDGRAFIRWKCTSCQYFVCTEKGTPDMKYCPNCGRKVSVNAAD